MYRRILLFCHRWLSLAASVPLVMLGVSGAIIAFEVELDRALNPGLWSVTPAAERQTWQKLVDQASESSSGNPPLGLRLPAADDQAAEISFGGGRLVYVDPYTGRILGSRLRSQILLGQIHQFHTKLLAGKYGAAVAGASSLLLILVSLSGLVLWWRTKVWKFPVQRRTKRWNFDVHSALGLYALVFWVVLGGTGAFIAFEGVSHSITYWLTRTAPIEPPRLQSSWTEGAKRISVDDVLQRAQQGLPEAVATVVSFPQQKTDVFTVILKYPDDRTPAGRSRIFADAYSGEVLWTTDAHAAPRGTWVVNHNRPLHTGDQWGWPSRLLLAAASLLLPLQVVTGTVLWWRGRRAARSTR